MKRFFLLTLTILFLWVGTQVGIMPASALELWTGPPIEFVRPENVDGWDPANMDQITDNVWITRLTGGGSVWNYILDSEVMENFTPCSGPYPSDTEWAYGDIAVVRTVGRQAFDPVPAVESALWRLRFLPRPRFTLSEEAAFFALVRAVYGVRRKMLRRALRSLLPRDALEGVLSEAGVDPTRRGETLSFEELDRLAASIRRATQRTEGPAE